MIARFPKHPTKTPLREKLDKVLKKYLKKFCKKHDMEFEYAVGDDLMGVICLNDFYFNINDIIYDIDNDLPKHIIFSWYEATINKKTDYNLHLYYKEWELKKMALEETKTTK